MRDGRSVEDLLLVHAAAGMAQVEAALQLALAAAAQTAAAWTSGEGLHKLCVSTLQLLHQLRLLPSTER